MTNIKKMTDDELDKAIKRAGDLIVECLTVNKIPHEIGLAALTAVITSTMRAHNTFEEYQGFMKLALELGDLHWEKG